MSEEAPGPSQLLRDSPSGTFKLFRSSASDPDLERAMANWESLNIRLRHAKGAGCFMEAIALRSQLLDLWLRMYYENVPHVDPRRRDFVQLLRQCFDLGLDKALHDRIHQFNKLRVDAVHGFLVGATSYDDMADAIEGSDGLTEDLAAYVLRNAGEALTAADADREWARGDVFWPVEGFIQHIKSGPPA